ncbi:MAG: hypothetical protein BWX77_01219 [Bacteroidetes bacterium ADurb.Bin090]|nr:MAG: hypothetical protein BWX77_01219 [Bacteroidetes bacterium ADurb.Bin090]
MGSRSHRNILFGNVNADRQALLVDIWKMFFGFSRLFMGNVQINIIGTPDFHLGVDGAGNDIAGSQ